MTSMLSALTKRRGAAQPLVANSLFLMLATGGSALFGFFFWILVAHHFSPATVGLATTLLSMSSLLSLLGLAGFDTIFVRFLAKSKRQSDHINSGLIISATATTVVAAAFCLLVPVLSPKLLFVQHHIWYVIEFIVVTILATWNTLTNAVLVAYRRTSFVLGINIIFSAVRLILPFMISGSGPMVIFGIVGIAQIVNVLLSIGAMMRYFDYRPALKVHTDIVRETVRYGAAVYVASVCNLLPDSALPLIVVNKLGAAAAAFFYVAFTIANLLYAIAFSTTQSLLAEAAHDEVHLGQHLRRAVQFIAALMIPAIAILVAICPFVLAFFGHGYRVGAVSVLRLLAVSGLAVMIYSVFSTTFKITNNLRAILAITSSNAAVIIGLSLLLAGRYGLTGVGWAWLIGNAVSVIVGSFFVRAQRRKPHDAGTISA